MAGGPGLRIVAFHIIFIFFLPLTGHSLDEWPHFYPDDPLSEDHDDERIPRPHEVELSQYYDFLENTFLAPGGREAAGALNTNTLGEVPNSSWFVNRHGMKRLSLEELVRGSNTGTGPRTDSPWIVMRGKTEGITPGFVIRDALGDVYFIKFDSPHNPEMATSAEAICTPLFHAIGYHVPENYVMDIDTRALTVGEDAVIRDEYGKKRKMTAEDLATILGKAPVRGDGTLRVIASKALPGESLGHFRYYGTRPDDANDIIPHEHRRELRGLRVFSAWLNHDDARSINSLDVYTPEGSVKHYLIDFGSCLGSGSVKPQTRRAGNEYMWEAGPTAKTMASLGLWVRPYLRIDYPEYPSIGRFESKAFRPELWRPEYPNPAFERMDENDAFWAARIVMSFTDQDVRAVVEAGMLSDREAREYLIATLSERRDKIGAYYLPRVNPLDGFTVSSDTLCFDNLEVKYGFGTAPRGYAVTWRGYDNEARRPLEVIEGGRIFESAGSPDLPLWRTSLLLPGALAQFPDGSFVLAEITSPGGIPADTQRPVRVFLRKSGGAWELVGIERS